MAVNVDPLMDAIEKYLAKADTDLEEQLTIEGFIAAAEAVNAINRIEDSIRDITQGHVDDIVEAIATDEGLRSLAGMEIESLDSIQELEATLYRALRQEYDEMVRTFTFEFVCGEDPTLPIVDRKITERTQDTINEVSRTYSKTTTKWVEPKLVNMIKEEYEAGSTVEQITQKIYQSGIRDTAWKARRLALTEVLRMESIGQQESFFQDPECGFKEWVYTWAAKDPRANHIAMNGQKVEKDKPFSLGGADGGAYAPMFPRDSCLPAGETINCHCIMRPVRDGSTLGMSEDEKAKLRQQILAEEDAKWQAEHARDNIEMIKGLSETDQIRYFGGKKKAEPYRSLIRSGVIDTDKKLEDLYYFQKSGKREQKSLKQLAESGIYTVDEKAMEHTMIGHKSNIVRSSLPPGGVNGGNIKTGGHSYAALQYLKDNNIPYNIEKTYSNGVMIGGYKGAESSRKKYGKDGQSWFPQSWDETKIRDAGTFVVNRFETVEKIVEDGVHKGYQYLANYDGMTVGVFTDIYRNVETIFPDTQQRLLGDIT